MVRRSHAPRRKTLVGANTPNHQHEPVGVSRSREPLRRAEIERSEIVERVNVLKTKIQQLELRSPAKEQGVSMITQEWNTLNEQLTTDRERLGTVNAEIERLKIILATFDQPAPRKTDTASPPAFAPTGAYRGKNGAH